MAQKKDYSAPAIEETEEDLERLRKRRNKLKERKRQEMIRRRRQQMFYRILVIFLLVSILSGVIYLSSKGGSGNKKPKPTQASGSVIQRPGSTTKEEKTTEASKETQTTAESVTETSSEETMPVPTEPPTTAPPPPTDASQAVYQSGIKIPSWVNIALIEPNSFSRPQTAINPIKNIVIHWVGNAGSRAIDNRDYFDSLRIESVNPNHVQASSHFVVGLEGEVVECVPLNEIAYAQGSTKSPYNRNTDCISIETCHPDWDGKFNNSTYWSVVKLSAFLCQQYGLPADCLMRHHDVSGKDCPKYYVEHPDAWEQLKADVASYMQQHPDIANEFP